MPDDSKAMKLVNYLVDHAIDGVPPLSGCESLAQEYRIDQSYDDDDHRVKSLIRWEMSKNFTSGFITGLGGLITLPIAIPAALTASWIVQARMSGAIACIYGHSINEDRVRTLVLLSLLGDAVKEPLKQAGIKVGTKITAQVFEAIPGKVLIAINKAVGFRLITKAGQTGIVNLVKIVPVVGGAVGGTVDAWACSTVGDAAQKIFRP